MLFTFLLCRVCWQTRRPSVVGEISHHRRSREDFIRKIKQNRPNIELRWTVAEAERGREPCGRRVREFRYLHASSPNTFSTDKQWTFPGLPPELFLRGSPCYEPQLHWLQQAVQPQCQTLCGPTSLGSAHTGLTDCPCTKRMKYSWVTPLCGGCLSTVKLVCCEVLSASSAASSYL